MQYILYRFFFFFFQITSYGELHSLTIPEIFADDEGSYFAKATNSAGESQCSCQLKVRLPPPVMEAAPPEFSQQFQDVRCQEGDGVTFICVPTGQPRPKVTWLFNDQPVSNPTYRIGQDGDRHTLHIAEVYKEDEGVYRLVEITLWCCALH